MELMSYNVEAAYRKCVRSLINENLCVDKKEFAKYLPDIQSMLSLLRCTFVRS